MPIEIYPSLLPGRPIETHAVSGMTLGAWLQSKGISYEGLLSQPITVTINGAALPVDAWDATEIGPSDIVQIRVLPHGGLFKALGSIIGSVFKLAFGWLTPSAKSSSNRSPDQGAKLETSQATANTAKLGEVVPELAGRFRRFPDYLTPPRRYFRGPREQFLEFLCCVGPGEYQIDPADVKIGATTFASLGGDAEYQFVGPGGDVGFHSAHEHWFTSTEVGGTSSGSAGLEITAEYTSAINPAAPDYYFSGSLIDAHNAYPWPPSWSIGTEMSIRAYLPYQVRLFQPEDAPARNRVYGDFREVAPAVNDILSVTIEGWGSPDLRVMEVGTDEFGGYLSFMNTSGDTWVSDMPVGAQLIGFVVPNRRYRVTSYAQYQIQVAALQSNGVVVPGWAGWPAGWAAADIVVIPTTVYGDWSGLFMAVPNLQEVTDALELDFQFGNGLGYIENSGRISARSVVVEVQYRDARVGGTFSSYTQAFTDATLDQIGFTVRIAMPGIAPEVRVRRIGSQDTSTQLNDKIQWYGLKARLQTRTSYPNWTTMVVRVRSGGRLGAQSENQINVVATRVLPVLNSDGSWSAPQPTRDIASIARYIATSIGYTDANFDMDELRRLHGVWSSRGETLDYVFDETTVREALNTAFGAGMAEFSVEDGLIRPVRDGVRTVFEQSYSAQNMTGPLRRSFQARRVDDYDGVEVEFTNGATWSQDTIKCLLPGDQGFKLEKLTLRGVTDRTRTWRIGMRRRRELRYRNRDYSFSTELDALNSRYLSYVPLIADDPGYGQSAILEHIEADPAGALLHVSEPLQWADGQTHVIAYRRPDGTLAGPFAASAGIDEYSVRAAIPQPWPVVTLKQEPPHVYFGTTERWSFPALITEIRPNGTETVSVSAVNYDVRVYADDDNAP